MDSEEASIWRRNRDLTLTVRCDIAEGLQPPDVTAKIKPSIDAIAATLPPEYRIEVGGATKNRPKPTHPFRGLSSHGGADADNVDGSTSELPTNDLGDSDRTVGFDRCDLVLAIVRCTICFVALLG